MSWLLLAILTAIFEASKDVWSKSSLQQLNLYLVAWSLPLFSVICLSPTLLWMTIPPLGDRFWVALLVDGCLNTLATLLYTRAIACSDLSITVPFVNFTPLFLLITSPLIVAESLTVFDAWGSVLIVVGSYVLNVQAKQQGFWTPLRAIWSDPGPRLMLVVAAVWSITANLDKVGVQSSSPFLWLIALYTFMTIGMLPFVLANVPQPLGQVRQHWRSLFPIGVFSALGIGCQMMALPLTLVAHVISVKRTSTLLASLMGHLLFQEPGFRTRITGAGIMIAGVFFILWG